MVDLLEGAPELAVNGALDAQLERALRADERLTRIARASARTAGAGQGLTTLLCGLAMWGSLLVGISAVRSGALAGVLLAVIALVPLAAFELVTGLPVATQTLRARARARPRVCSRSPTRRRRCSSRLTRRACRRRRTACGARAARRVLGPTGPGRSTESTSSSAPGRRVAVVGPSGAGKSTLAEVLLRFLPYQRGSVTLNGVEIAELDGDDYRRVVGMVAQDAHIFDTTLAENLLLARRAATSEELDARSTQARLLDWARGAAAGLQTEVGECGARLSGGQRQRLAIARALLADFPVLILDEPGEHLETQTADAIVADLLGAARRRRGDAADHPSPAGPRGGDEVIVLDRGRVLERGQHAELLAPAVATPRCGGASAVTAQRAARQARRACRRRAGRAASCA